MAQTPLQAAGAHAGEHHIVPTSTYVKTLVALTILMLLTIWAGVTNLPDIGPISGTIVNQTIALLIAGIKASLVVWIFMGIKWGTKLTRLWVAISFTWFTLLGLILIDYPMRAFEATQGWEGKPGQPDYGSALPRVVTPSSQAQPVERNEINIRPRQ